MRDHELDDLLRSVRDVGLDNENQDASERRLTARWNTRATPGTRPRSLRWRHGRLPLLVAAATLTIGGGAVAAKALLQTGAPVPADTSKALSFGTVLPGTTRVVDVGARDPEGGPGWAIMLYGLELPEQTFPNGDPIAARRLVCATVGRTQSGKVGVVGRDGVFNNDGRFHELIPEMAAIAKKSSLLIIEISHL